MVHAGQASPHYLSRMRWDLLLWNLLLIRYCDSTEEEEFDISKSSLYPQYIECVNKEAWCTCPSIIEASLVEYTTLTGLPPPPRGTSLAIKSNLFCKGISNDMRGLYDGATYYINAGIHDSWKVGDVYPSLHYMKGLALFNLHRIGDAVAAFEYSATHFKDFHSYSGLGDALLHGEIDLGGALHAYLNAERINGVPEIYARIQKAREWVGDLQDYDKTYGIIHHAIEDAYEKKLPPPVRVVDVMNVDPQHLTYLAAAAYGAKGERPLLPHGFDQVVHGRNGELQRQDGYDGKLRVGFLSSEYGTGPVGTLIRGALISFSRDIHVTAYKLHDNRPSWFEESVRSEVDVMKSLEGVSYHEAAKLILADQQDILIDLCGLTLGNGLPILAHRPAPIQVSYLGNSETTGADHIDYMVIDTRAVPPDVSAFTFTEKLAFLPSSFMVTDVAQLSRFDSPHRDPYFTKKQVGLNDIPPGAFVFATFCNYKKIEPLIMSTWLNILRRVPQSVLWLLQFKGHTVAIDNLHRELQAAGIDPSRVVMTKYAPWVHHFGHKSVADLVLDTYIKNGHTTTSDALWAGVPVLTLSGLTLSQRWAGSLLHAMNASESVVYSFKEYEDVAVILATHNTLRQFFRRKVRANRWTQPPFQTLMWASNFERFLKSTWNVRSSYKSLYPLHVVVVPLVDKGKDLSLTPRKKDDDDDFIYQWLKYDVELIQYLDNFKEQSISRQLLTDSLQSVDGIVAKLKIKPLGHRVRISNAIRVLREH